MITGWQNATWDELVKMRADAYQQFYDSMRQAREAANDILILESRLYDGSDGGSAQRIGYLQGVKPILESVSAIAPPKQEKT